MQCTRNYNVALFKYTVVSPCVHLIAFNNLYISSCMTGKMFATVVGIKFKLAHSSSVFTHCSIQYTRDIITHPALILK